MLLILPEISIVEYIRHFSRLIDGPRKLRVICVVDFFTKFIEGDRLQLFLQSASFSLFFEFVLCREIVFHNLLHSEFESLLVFVDNVL